MNFFQQLAAMGNIDLNLRIMQKNDKLTINVEPGIASDKIQPMIITATPAELDAEFFTSIMPEVKEITGIISNLADAKKEASEKQSNKPKEKPAAAKKEKPAKKAPAKKSKVKPVVETSLFEPAPEPAADQTATNS